MFTNRKLFCTSATKTVPFTLYLYKLLVMTGPDGQTASSDTTHFLNHEKGLTLVILAPSIKFELWVAVNNPAARGRQSDFGFVAVSQ